MHWTIDTGVLGAAGCDAKDLRKVLEAELKNHEKTAPETAAREVASRFPPGEKDPTKILEMSKTASAASDAVKAKLPKVQAQMNAGIDAAEGIAASMGGQVTATVQGHLLSNHPGGIFQRIVVSVDRAAPTGE